MVKFNRAHWLWLWFSLQIVKVRKTLLFKNWTFSKPFFFVSRLLYFFNVEMIWACLVRINRVKTRMVFINTFCCKMSSMLMELFILDHVTFTASWLCWRFNIWVKSRGIWIMFVPKWSMSIWNYWCSLSHYFLVIFWASGCEIVLRSIHSWFFFPLNFGRLNVVSTKSFNHFLELITVSSHLIIFSFICHSIVLLEEISSKTNSWEI